MSQSCRNSPAFGDVAIDADQADDPAVTLVTYRDLADHRPERTVSSRDHALLVEHGLARSQDVAIFTPIEFGFSRGEEVRIGLAEDSVRVPFAKMVAQGLICQGETALQILGVHEVGQLVE